MLENIRNSKYYGTLCTLLLLLLLLLSAVLFVCCRSIGAVGDISYSVPSCANTAVSSAFTLVSFSLEFLLSRHPYLLHTAALLHPLYTSTLYSYCYGGATGTAVLLYVPIGLASTCGIIMYTTQFFCSKACVNIIYSSLVLPHKEHHHRQQHQEE